MKNAEKPSETIFSMQMENRTLRWMVLLLCLTVVGLAIALVFKPAPTVWFVHERGEILKNDGKVFTWAPAVAVQRAFEVMFVPGERRGELLGEFFSGNQKEVALAHTANDRFVFFRVTEPVSVENGEVFVLGTLFRDGKDSTKMRVGFKSVAPTDTNPFGLVITSVTVVP